MLTTACCAAGGVNIREAAQTAVTLGIDIVDSSRAAAGV